MESNTVSIANTTGTEPPTTVTGAGMSHADGLIFFYGGKSSSTPNMFIYCLDIERLWWFIFHVVPDMETVTSIDGYVNEAGLFMIPRFQSFANGYDGKNRVLFFTLGIPESDPPEIHEIYIGDALAVIHQRDDMMRTIVQI